MVTKVTGSAVEQLPGGALRFSITENGSPVASIEMAGAQASMLAGQVLHGARGTQELASLPIPEHSSNYTECAPSQMTVGSSRQDGKVCLIAIFGQAVIGFTLDPDACRQIGEAMIAASAGGSRN